MKKVFNYFFTKFILGFGLSVMLFISCSEENTTIDDSILLEDFANTTSQIQVDQVNEYIIDIVDNTSFDNILKSANNKTSSNEPFLPNCTFVKKVVTKKHEKITIDFGKSCTDRNGNVLKGKIIILKKVEVNLVTLKYTFANFHFNTKKVVGKIHRTITRKNGHPYGTIILNLKFLNRNQTFITLKGEKQREWIEGYGSGTWKDNVFLITGSWTIVMKDGTIRNSTVIENLRREMLCPFFVSGILSVEENNKTTILDYGNGDCNDFATLTSQEREYKISL